MTKKIKNYFNDWNKFELSFLSCGLLLSILISLIFNGTIIDTLYTSLYFVTALLMSKGKVESYFVGIISVIFYGIISFEHGYYGELLITIFLTFPLMVIGIVSWAKHQDKEENVVLISNISKKEIIISLISQLVLYWMYYYLLKYFNTDLLYISAVSIVTSVLASYYEARRSEISLVFYIINDIILICLWGLPILQGNTELIPVIVGPILLLINDIYGSYNWKKIKFKQKEKELKIVMNSL